jgi:hypothetical protein
MHYMAQRWVNARYNGSIAAEITLSISPYKSLKIIQMNMVAILKNIFIPIFE